MFNLILKTLYDKRSFIIGWGIGMALMSLLMIVVYPSFQNFNLDEMLKNVPPAMKGLVDVGNLKTLAGYIGAQLFDVRLPMFIGVSSIMLAVGLTVTEEEKGYLRTLSALPASRLKIFFSKLLTMVLINLAITISTVIGIYIGLFVIGESIDANVIIRLAAMTWLMSTCLTSIVFGIGMATGKKGITMGIGVILTIASFILTTFAKSVDWLKPYEKLSIFHYFPASDIATKGIDIVDVAVFAGLIVVFVVYGAISFHRRDIR